MSYSVAAAAYYLRNQRNLKKIKKLIRKLVKEEVKLALETK